MFILFGLKTITIPQGDRLLFWPIFAANEITIMIFIAYLINGLARMPLACVCVRVCVCVSECVCVSLF